MMRALPMLLLLAACARGPDAVRDTCERQAESDPEVKRLIIKGVGSAYFLHKSQDELNAAKQDAMTACLRERGVIRKGGVERQKPL